MTATGAPAPPPSGTPDPPRTLRLHARLEPVGPAAAFMLTDEQVAALGHGRTPPVRVRVGDRSVATRVGLRGAQYLVGLSKSARATLEVAPGDELDVEITLDEAPREIEIPAELARALSADPAAKAAFDALAPSHRKEHARSVAEAVRDETRARRVDAVLSALRAG